MNIIIRDENEAFVDFRIDGTPEWSRFEEEYAQHFFTRQAAVKVSAELRALGFRPRIVDLDKAASVKQKAS